MPMLALPNEETVLYYVIPSSTCDPPALDPDKSTILLIHSHTCDVSIFEPQFRDPRLTSTYNLVAFDLPDHGQTKNPSKQFSIWVVAALLAKGLDALDASPVFLLASNYYSIGIAIFFTILFPNSVRGVFLAGDYLSLESNVLLDQWVKAVDQRTLASTCVADLADPAAEVMRTVLGTQLTPEQIHTWIHRWLQRYVCCADRYTGLFTPWRTRAGLPPQEMSAIRVPVTIAIPSEKSPFIPHPETCLSDVIAAIDQAQGGTEVHTIEGGEGYNLAYTSPDRINALLVTFLEKNASYALPPQPIDWSTAWRKFTATTGQPFRRTPRIFKSLDFNTLSKDQQNQLEEKIKSIQQQEQHAIQLLGKTFTKFWNDGEDVFHPELTEEICFEAWNKPML